ncbi:hypothetical protein V1525DRAFT_415605 [Lipomyces kononenkoae]|uniref:Uncharacterized protein n=1 Tax=Lipomyces kononenkoae TaxID=34357 RepID=A0ACC3SQ48_LIPKO
MIMSSLAIAKAVEYPGASLKSSPNMISSTATSRRAISVLLLWINVIPEHPQFFLPVIGKFLSGVFPTFMLSDWLTPLGISRTKLLTHVQGGQYFSEFLFSNATEAVNPDWDSSYYVDVFSKLGNPRNLPYK